LDVGFGIGKNQIDKNVWLGFVRSELNHNQRLLTHFEDFWD